MTVRLYTVTWEINEYADSPEEAARRARATLLNPGSVADIFEVTDEDPDKPGFLRSVTVDLSNADGCPTG